MTWASDGDFLLWYSESMSEPELCYCTGGNKLDQNFHFYQTLFLHFWTSTGGEQRLLQMNSLTCRPPGCCYVRQSSPSCLQAEYWGLHRSRLSPPDSLSNGIDTVAAELYTSAPTLTHSAAERICRQNLKISRDIFLLRATWPLRPVKQFEGIPVAARRSWLSAKWGEPRWTCD